MNTLSNTLAIFAPFIAGLVVDRWGANFGVRVLYGVMGSFSLISLIVNLRYLKDPAPRAHSRLRPAELPRILKDAYSGIPNMLKQFPLPLKALAGVIVLNFMANGVASPFWVVFAVEEIGLSPSAWGLILLLETVLKLVLFIPAGLLVDRWGRTASLRVALLLSLVAIPLFAFAGQFIEALLLRLVIAVAFAIAIPACTALMADLVPRQMRGRVMSAIGQGGIMIGPAGGGTGGPAMGYIITIPLMLSSLFGGYLYHFNPTFTWFFAGITTALALLLTLLFIRDPQTAEV